MATDGGVIHDGSATGPKHDRDLVLHQQQHAADVNIANLMVVLDRLLGDEQAEVALGAGVVESVLTLGNDQKARYGLPQRKKVPQLQPFKGSVLDLFVGCAAAQSTFPETFDHKSFKCMDIQFKA